MADVTTPGSSTSSCCSPQAQRTCCDPVDKHACCETRAPEGTCGCAAGEKGPSGIRAAVRRRYAAAARASREGQQSSCGCDPPIALSDAAGRTAFGGSLYDDM